MNTVKTGLRSMLTSDATYKTLLGSPVAEPYKTYYMYPPTEPDFPFTVFWMGAGSFQDEHDRYIIARVSELYLNVWAQDNVYETIIERIIYLYHHKSNAYGFRAILSREPQEIYDEEMNAYGKNIVFNLHFRRGII